MKLLLIGAGHAHIVVLREFARRRKARAEALHTTLVSSSAQQVYSGMLPGLIAGHYARTEIEIDVARLAGASGAQFVQGVVTGIDPGAGRVTLADARQVDYDLLSINAGSLPNFSVAPGSERWAIPVKPFEQFLAGWDEIRAAASQRAIRVALVGAGTAGVEVSMTMARALGNQAHLTLYSEKSMFPDGVARRIGAALERARVELRKAAPVSAVEEGPLLVAGGARERFDFVVWTAGAAPLAMYRAAGLALDKAGFILIDDCLRSVSHENVFAAGDSATLRVSPHPKSGVYAIRHGAVLERNLRHAAAGEPLEPYVPQQRSLALISTGERYAIATYGDWSAEGGWLWRLKDWIDRRWMSGFA